MTHLSGYCTNCGSEIEGGASFCTKCGASTSQTLQNDVEEKSSEGGRDYRRYLAVDKTGGFLGIAAPIFVWSTAAGVLMWSVIGLISLRFHIGYVDLSDLLFSMLIILAIMLSVAANSYIVHSYRGRGRTALANPIVPSHGMGSLFERRVAHIDNTSLDRFRGRIKRTPQGDVFADRCGVVWYVQRLLVTGSHRIKPSLPLGASSDVRLCSRHRIGGPGCVVVDREKPAWKGVLGAFSNNRRHRHHLHHGVLHHGLHYCSGENLQGAAHRSSRIPGRRHCRIHDRCGVFVGRLILRPNPICPRRDRNGVHHYYWIAGGAPLPKT